MNKSLLALIMTLVLAGCSTLQKMTPSYKEAQRRADTLQQLQLSTMRFADQYSTRVVGATTRWQAATQDPEERLTAQIWKLEESEAAVINASGPNTIDCALDMVVLATLSRMVIDDQWTKYGTRAEFLRETQHDLEQGAWQLVTPVLSDKQKEQLNELIIQWREQHLDVSAVQAVHFSQFAKSIQPSESSRFSLLGFNPLSTLDPLSSLDPAVREITQTRQLAERSIFYFQRMPAIISMQAQRLSTKWRSLRKARARSQASNARRWWAVLRTHLPPACQTSSTGNVRPCSRI